MGIENRVNEVEGRLDGLDVTLTVVTAEVKGLMQMPGIYGAEYGKIRTALEGHDKRFDRVDATLREHGDKLMEYDKRFDRLDATLREHGDKLMEHDKRFDRLEELISHQGQELREHRNLLEQILAKVA